MTDLPADIAAALARPVIEKATCVTILFSGNTVRLWDGFGWLKTGDGLLWRGSSALVNFSALTAASLGGSSRLKLSLSGVDGDLGGLAWDSFDAGEILGTEVTVDFYFFGTDGRPVSTPFRQLEGLILKFSDEPSDINQTTGQQTQTLTIEVGDAFAIRSEAPNLYLSQQWLDQMAPGASGLSLVPTLFDATMNFPDFR